MSNPLLLIISCVISFIIFVFFVVTGIVKKSFIRIILSMPFLCGVIGCLFFLGVYAASKATSKMKEAVTDVRENFKARTGDEIYYSLFGKPLDKCLKIINKQDQVVPRLDCCIWLEFQTCPKELNRIIAQQRYKATKYFSLDTTSYVPDYNPKPAWWTPHLLSDSVNVMEDFNSDNPNRDKILIFARDSSRVFYCDMAD